MTTLVLATSDIGLFADFEATRVDIPHLITGAPTGRRDSTLIHLEGLDYPVAAHGTHRDGTVSCIARFTYAEHEQMVALNDLLAAAAAADDDRLQLRTNRGLVAGLDPLLVGVVSEVSESYLGGQAHDVSFTLQRTYYSVEA